MDNAKIGDNFKNWHRKESLKTVFNFLTTKLSNLNQQQNCQYLIWIFSNKLPLSFSHNFIRAVHNEENPTYSRPTSYPLFHWGFICIISICINEHPKRGPKEEGGRCDKEIDQKAQSPSACYSLETRRKGRSSQWARSKLFKISGRGAQSGRKTIFLGYDVHGYDVHVHAHDVHAHDVHAPDLKSYYLTKIQKKKWYHLVTCRLQWYAKTMPWRPYIVQIRAGKDSHVLGTRENFPKTQEGTINSDNNASEIGAHHY